MTGGGLTGLDILPDRLSATEWPLIEALLKEGREVTVLHSGITDKHTHTHIRADTRPREVPGRRLAIKETEISRSSRLFRLSTRPTARKSPQGPRNPRENRKCTRLIFGFSRGLLLPLVKSLPAKRLCEEIVFTHGEL